LRLVALLALVACSHPSPPPPKPAPLITANQVVTAVIDDWSSTTATVTLFQRDPRGGWGQTKSWQAVIGHAGAAWGIGLHGNGAPAGHAGPVKKEGDGASPAGVFALPSAFGYQDLRNSSLPFTTAGETTECVDDPQSHSYNQIVERTPAADWTSSEHMKRPDELYALGVFVAHNPQHVPGGGSCIFLHVWAGPDSTTVGCTAMPKDRLFHLMSALAPGAVFVLLPRAEYSALRDQWGLPPQ
jgi:L,D-peptidoglycan transpeptidase YkuD (ErfK/YbiS/YcfS/YnhG family)